MPTYDLFSNRHRRAAANNQDVYQYEVASQKLRVQIAYIWRGASTVTPGSLPWIWQEVHHVLCREHGLDSLGTRAGYFGRCDEYLRHGSDMDVWVDLVELSFRFIIGTYTDYHETVLQADGISETPENAVHELNFRFREARLGYQFEGNQIIRIDSELTHAEFIKPALSFLADKRFAGPDQEFRHAHAHYRAGEYRDAIIDANNAFESTLKTICDLKGWKYATGARASDLLKVVRTNGLLPDYLDKAFDQLVATLASGLPEVRNNVGAHGQGAAPKDTPPYIAGYALHLAASNILLLKEASGL